MSLTVSQFLMSDLFTLSLGCCVVEIGGRGFCVVGHQWSGGDSAGVVSTVLGGFHPRDSGQTNRFALIQKAEGWVALLSACRLVGEPPRSTPPSLCRERP